MRAIMLTIRLKWFYLTYKGIKTIEVRKSAPKDFVGDVFEVVSKTNFEKDLMEIPENEREFFKQFKGKVGLKFTLNKVEEITIGEDRRGSLFGSCHYGYHTESLRPNDLMEQSCLDVKELIDYLGKKGYAWHISNLVIFDRPRELSEFYHYVKYNKEMATLNNQDWDFCKLTKAPQSYQFIEVGE